MTMPMGDLLKQVDIPEGARLRMSALLSGCGFAEAIDAAMLDDDLIASIAESNEDLRLLTLVWHAARPPNRWLGEGGYKIRFGTSG